MKLKLDENLSRHLKPALQRVNNYRLEGGSFG